MPPLLWLTIAVVAAVAAVVVGLPAWRSSRARAELDLNAERYRSWRGHGTAGESSSQGSGWTSGERQRLVIGAVLVALGLIALIAFFINS